MEELERLRLAELEEDLSPGEKCERAMQAAINEAEAEVEVEVPEEYVCPLSTEIMREPVSCPSGITYERCWIERWLETEVTCPVTRKALNARQLFPNV